MSHAYKEIASRYKKALKVLQNVDSCGCGCGAIVINWKDRQKVWNLLALPGVNTDLEDSILAEAQKLKRKLLEKIEQGWE